MTTATPGTRSLRALSLTGLALLGAACTVVGPDYVRPVIDVPAAYKEADASMAPAAPSVPTPARWWGVYADSQLDALVEQLEAHSPSLQSAAARVRRAHSLAEAARAAQSPTIVAGGKNDLGVLLSWEIDLWGRIRRDVEANGARAQASAADLDATRLSMQAQLVQGYLELRLQDATIRLWQAMAAGYEHSLQIMRNQYAVGVASHGGVAQAQAQLATVQAQVHRARLARAQFEHALAALIGKAPADFSIAAAPLNMRVPQVPEVPAAPPATLLERRPDVVAAERRVAAASARIGVAQAESYPSLGLSIGASVRKGLVGGSNLRAPLYAAQAPDAQHSEALAAYDEAVADYRQAVLNGFREVEDQLAAARLLGQAAVAQGEAVESARESVRIANHQNRAGVLGALSVVLVQASALETERAALELLGRRLVASVALIKALGGGWDGAAPKPVGN